MSAEDLKKAEDEEKRRREEARKQLIKGKWKDRFDRLTRPWLPSYLNSVVFEEFLWKHQTKFESLDKACFVGVLILVLCYAFVSFICHKIFFGLPLLLHSYLIFQGNGIGFPIIVLIIWFMNQFRKIFHVHMPEDYYMDAFNIRSSDPRLSSSSSVEFFFSMFAILVVSQYVFSTENGAKIEGVWITVLGLTLCRFVPGFGANSTMGMVSMVFMFLVAFLSTPTIFSKMMKTVATVTSAESGPAYLNTMPFEYSQRQVFDLLKIGISTNSGYDAIRYIAGFAPMVWTVVDSFQGPGYAIRAAS